MGSTVLAAARFDYSRLGSSRRTHYEDATLSAPSASHKSSLRRLLAALGSIFVIIFITEALVMAGLGRLPPLSFWTEALLDSALLSILVLPFVYLLVLRPLERYASARDEAERGLRTKDRDFRDTVEKYRAIVENAVEGIYQTTPGGEFITANAALAHMLGYESLAQLMAQGHGIAARVYAEPTSRELFMERIALDGAVQGLEFEVLCRDGTRRWVSENAHVVRDASGAVQYYEGTMMDITLRRQAQLALLESERLLRESQSIGGFGNYTLDISSGVWTSSAVLDDIFGIDAGFDRSIAGWVSLIRPDWQDRLSTYVTEEVIGRRNRFDLVYPILRRTDGTERWVHGLGGLDLDPEGRPVRLIGTIRDVTDRKRASDALQDSEAKFKALFEAARVAIIVMDRKTILDCNPQAERLFASAKRDLVGHSPVDFSPRFQPDGCLSAERAAQHIDAALGGTPQFFEWRHVRTDGTTFDAEVSLNKVDLHGTMCLQAVVRDITARKQAEADLRLQGAALDAAASAIVITASDGTIVWANPALFASSGYAPSEVVGKNPRDLFKSGTHDDTFYADLWRVLLAGDVWRGEIVNRRKDGNLRTEDMTITPIKDHQGVVTHFVAVRQDVTERKQLELQFLRAQRLESIGLLAGGIAHDLNNVLAPIIMSVELLRDTVVDDDGRSLVETIGTSAQRGVDMVAQVLSFARGSEGHRVNVQLRHLIHDMEKIAAKMFPKNIEVTTAVRSDLWTVHGDPTQLHQVLLNLCINARDAMPDGGHITITAANETRDDGPYVVLDVEDTGVGMPQAIIDKIFDPFFTTKPIGQGTGLGLSTSLTIVKGHGGFVQVTSEPRTGTRFRVFLPSQNRDLEPGDGAAAPDWPRGHGETVLVVDDEAAIREITRHTLEAFGYRVMLASDGAEAVSLYEEHADTIAMVITDLMMPVMDGIAVIHALAQVNPNVPVLAVSGASAATSVTVVDAGVGVFPVLAKPFSREALLRAVRDAMEGHGPRNLDLFE